MLCLTRYPIPRTLCGAHFLKSNLNEYILEPEEVAVEPVAANFDDGVKTFSISKSQVMKQLIQLGETISYKQTEL